MQKGVLVDGFCELTKADKALVVEARAIRRSIKLVIEKKYQKVVVEMDSKVVHDEIKCRRKWAGIGGYGL